MTEKKKIASVDDLEVYQAFFDLALQVEKATKSCNGDFRWLRIQALRSSESVCANLTEGFYTQYSTEYLQALYRCRREARETMTHLRYAMKVSQASDKIGSGLLLRYDDTLKRLSGLISSIERKIEERGKAKSRTLNGPLSSNH